MTLAWFAVFLGVWIIGLPAAVVVGYTICAWVDDRRDAKWAVECPTADEWDASRGLADYRDLPVRDAADLMFVDEVVAEWEATS